jgi:hypothetical protein
LPLNCKRQKNQPSQHSCNKFKIKLQQMLHLQLNLSKTKMVYRSQGFSSNPKKNMPHKQVNKKVNTKSSVKATYPKFGAATN